MGIRQKSAHGVIIQGDFRKCNPLGELDGFHLRHQNGWEDGFRIHNSWAALQNTTREEDPP